MTATLLAGGTLAIWLGLLASGFWRCTDSDERVLCDDPAEWPDVVAVVPARNEEDVIARSLASLAAQDYPGPFRIVLVDDNSTDATGRKARELVSNRITVMGGALLPAGWTGKLWALSQGLGAAGRPRYLWLTDADIEHAPDTLRRLAAIAEAGSDTIRLSAQSYLVDMYSKLGFQVDGEEFIEDGIPHVPMRKG